MRITEALGLAEGCSGLLAQAGRAGSCCCVALGRLTVGQDLLLPVPEELRDL